MAAAVGMAAAAKAAAVLVVVTAGMAVPRGDAMEEGWMEAATLAAYSVATGLVDGA